MAEVVWCQPMRAPYHPTVKGFEYQPEGRLLRTVIEMKGRMGIAYERCIDYVRESHHTHDRLNLSFPRGSCQVEIEVKRAGNRRRTFRIDSSKLLSLPKGEEHNHRGRSLVYDTVALYPSDTALEESGERIGIGVEEIRRFLGDCFVIARTAFLDELVERYFAERVLRDRPSPALRVQLEDQILDEVLRLFCGRRAESPAESGERQNITERALQFIEANLFAPISSQEIARYGRTSVASLFRVFKKDLRRTPFDYIRERRLDESL
jgi:hypothetical protein